MEAIEIAMNVNKLEIDINYTADDLQDPSIKYNVQEPVRISLTNILLPHFINLLNKILKNNCKFIFDIDYINDLYETESFTEFDYDFLECLLPPSSEDSNEIIANKTAKFYEHYYVTPGMKYNSDHSVSLEQFSSYLDEIADGLMSIDNIWGADLKVYVTDYFVDLFYED